jgi:hypothetical protein
MTPKEGDRRTGDMDGNVLSYEAAREWLELEKRRNAPPAIRFLAMQAVGRAQMLDWSAEARFIKREGGVSYYEAPSLTIGPAPDPLALSVKKRMRMWKEGGVL